jgi:L-ascorbate metabolism protein UlaG (beta-lactamase superfamily)
MKQTWHDYLAFRIETGEARIVINSFLADDPSADHRSSGYLTGTNLTRGGDR